MTFRDPFNYYWAREILILVMTLLGSIASYAYKMINGEKFSFWMFVSKILVSIFAGAFVYLTAIYYQWSTEYAGGVEVLRDGLVLNSSS